MQTFLPHTDFKKVAKVLDYRRLGKQRVEAVQILNAIHAKSGWSNHPAVLMWIGFEEALKEYCNTMIFEWIFRGYKNTMKLFETNNVIYPWWLGKRVLHSSHRANLLRKDFGYYSKYGWKEEPQQGYYWPVRKENLC